MCVCVCVFFRFVRSMLLFSTIKPRNLFGFMWYKRKSFQSKYRHWHTVRQIRTQHFCSHQIPCVSRSNSFQYQKLVCCASRYFFFRSNFIAFRIIFMAKLKTGIFGFSFGRMACAVSTRIGRNEFYEKTEKSNGVNIFDVILWHWLVPCFQYTHIH